MARIAVITQPTYLPWLGYFDLVDQSSVFILLDNVQFDKRSWQQRNRIRTSKGLGWLTVPVRVKGRYHQLIHEVEIMQPASFPADHLRAIELNYRRAPYFEAHFPGLQEILTGGQTLLRELNVQLIRWMAGAMGMKAEFELSSALGVNGKRSELLSDICKRVGAGAYLSAIGSAAYLAEDRETFEKKKIDVLFHNYEHPRYRQVFEPFLPYATALDLLFNEGAGSLDIIRSGRNKALNLQEAIERNAKN